MKSQMFLFIIALAAALVPSPAAAQHEAHQSAAPDAQLAQCAQVQPAVQNIIAAASARLESARQSNNPAEMRAAIDRFESALRDPNAAHTVCNSCVRLARRTSDYYANCARRRADRQASSRTCDTQGSSCANRAARRA